MHENSKAAMCSHAHTHATPQVTFYPWWKRRKQDFRLLFWDYDRIPAESVAALRRYYDSRLAMGQPMSMYPPGRIVFVRPIKSRREKHWDAVWISPEDLIDEGILLSPNMLTDHLCSTAWHALHSAWEASKGKPGLPGRERVARAFRSPHAWARAPVGRGDAGDLYLNRRCAAEYNQLGVVASH